MENSSDDFPHLPASAIQDPGLEFESIERKLDADSGDMSLFTEVNTPRLDLRDFNAEPNGTTSSSTPQVETLPETSMEQQLFCTSDTAAGNSTIQLTPGDLMELVRRFQVNQKLLKEVPIEIIQKISEAGFLSQDDGCLQCQYCNLKIPFHNLSDCSHLFVKHGEKSPSCLHVKNHPQETMQSHMDSCPQGNFECPFKLLGCTFRGTEEDVKHHQMDLNYHHTLVLEFKARQEALYKQIQDLTSDRTKLKQEIASLKHQVEELKFAGRGNMSSMSMGPPEQQGANITKVTCQDYSGYKERFQTFKSWPYSTKPSPDNLARAGFFYTGTGDDTECFACGKVLRLWEPNDDPWTEHVKWSPQCWFVQKRKEAVLIQKPLGVDGIIDVLLQMQGKR